MCLFEGCDNPSTHTELRKNEGLDGIYYYWCEEHSKTEAIGPVEKIGSDEELV